MDCFHRTVNVFFRMGRRDEARFIRGGGKVDALFQHVPEEGFEEFLGGFLRGVQVIDFLLREEEAEHGACAVEGVVPAVLPDGLADAFFPDARRAVPGGRRRFRPGAPGAGQGPAAMATGLPERVPAWYTGPIGERQSMISARPPKAPTGRPPPMTFPMQVRSGVMP